MSCNTERLSDYLDDELPAGARAEVDLHLASCAACRELLGELALVKRTAAELADLEQFPASDLWPDVERGMEPAAPAAGRQHAPLPFTPRAAAARSKAISLSWMQAMAASVALVAVSSGAVWLTMRQRAETAAAETARVEDQRAQALEAAAPMLVADMADETYEKAVRDLRAALDEGRNRLDPQTIQVIEKNLAAIDQAIEQARAALEADPANVSLNSYLVNVRRRKLELLRTASELTQSSLP